MPLNAAILPLSPDQFTGGRNRDEGIFMTGCAFVLDEFTGLVLGTRRAR